MTTLNAPKITPVPLSNTGLVGKYSAIQRWTQALMNAPTKGAANATAASDGLSQGGTDASFSMAKHDLPRVQSVVQRFHQAGTQFNIPAAILAAIASRESRCGAVLMAGMGDGGNAFGIMQIDRRFHEPVGLNGDPASQNHINQAAKILMDCLQQVQAKHPQWEDESVLQGAIAAYNSGVDNIQTKAGIDIGTTHDDYGSDVLARAQFYARKIDGWSGAIKLPTLPTTPMVSAAPAKVSNSGDIQLSPHFWLSEMIYSDAAIAHGIDNYPKDPAVIENLKALCLNALEPIRQHFGQPIIPSSGYRCPELNRQIDGAPNSHHLYGEAVDFEVPGYSIATVIHWIEQNLEFEELINEYDSWVHLAYKRNGKNRGSSFRIG